MKKLCAAVLVLALLGCSAKRQHLLPTSEKAVACVHYCEEEMDDCKSGCLWWLVAGSLGWIAIPCRSDCEKKSYRCEQICPDMEYPPPSASTVSR